MPHRRSGSTTRRSDAVIGALAACAGLLAALGPVSLTGDAVVDAVERALVAGAVTFVGSHARRWCWVAGAAPIALVARGPALWVAVAGLAVLVVATAPKRRSREAGAAGLALVTTAAFWLPTGSPAVAPLVVFVAFVLLLAGGQRYQRRQARRTVRIATRSLAGLALVAVVGLGLAGLLAAGHVNRGTTAAQRALAAARAGNGDQAAPSLSQALDEFSSADDWIGSALTFPARLLPGVAQQREAVAVAVEQGRLVADAGDDLVATADYDQLRYAGRIDLDQVAALAGPTERADAVLVGATDALDEVAAGSLLPPLRSRLDRFREELADARGDADLAGDVLRVAPGLLGGDGPRHYLIVFVTPAELRGAGGFIGSYAELSTTDGKAELTRSGRIMDLIQAVPGGTRTLSGPADYLKRYGRFDPQDYLQDVTISPDFPSDAQVLAQLYPQSGGREVDGVISVDPSGLAALLDLTGPVVVPGLVEPLGEGNAVEVLTRSQYVDVPDDAERGDILTEATRLTFEALTNASLPGPRNLADVLSPAARGGHLRMWSPIEQEQALLERLGADGSLRLAEGADGFSVVQQNLGNNKLDAYLQRSIDYRATVDAATGDLEATLTVTLANDAPALDLPRAIVGNSRGAPVGTNVAQLTVHTRHVVTSATIDGVEHLLAPSTELGLYAWDLPVLRVPPGGTTTVVLRLAGSVDLSDGYRLDVLPQPVANPDRFTAGLEVTGGSTDGGGGRHASVVRDQELLAPTTRRVTIDR